MAAVYGLRSARPRLRTGRPEGRDRRRQARPPGRHCGASQHDRRRVHQHRHGAVEDAAGGGGLPHRAQPAGDVRAELPAQGRHHRGRPRRPHLARDRSRGRRHPQPALPQPGRAAVGQRAVPGPAHGGGRRRQRPRDQGHAPRRSSSPPAPDRPGRPVWTSTSVTVIDSDGIIHLEQVPRSHGRGRRRGHRHRVRLDVRRPRHQGDRGRAARPDAGVLRPRDRRGAQVPPARPRRHVPVRRDGGGRGAPRAAARSRVLESGKRIAADDGHVLGRPPGHDRRAGAGQRRPGRRRPRPHPGRRALPHRGAAHLRRRRRDRLPRARLDLDGAGPPGRPPRLRRAGARDAPPAADRHLHASPR